MSTKEYIKEKLEALSKVFPQLTFFYKYDEVDETHVVEVLPLSEYDNNKEYKEAEADLTFDFDRSFFPETAMFVSEESLTRVTEPDSIICANTHSFWEGSNVKVFGGYDVFPFDHINEFALVEVGPEFNISEYSKCDSNVQVGPEINELSESEENCIYALAA